MVNLSSFCGASDFPVACPLCGRRDHGKPCNFQKKLEAWWHGRRMFHCSSCGGPQVRVVGPGGLACKDCLSVSMEHLRGEDNRKVLLEDGACGNPHVVFRPVTGAVSEIVCYSCAWVSQRRVNILVREGLDRGWPMGIWWLKREASVHDLVKYRGCIRGTRFSWGLDQVSTTINTRVGFCPVLNRFDSFLVPPVRNRRRDHYE